MQGGDNSSRDRQQQQQQNQNPPPPPPQPCPRCESTNTKFCYYNNYSVTQPRYFCKACRRYWTHGGTLRNIPVGGGVRKNKRSRPSSSASASSHLPPQPAPPLPPPPHVFPQLNLTNPAQSFLPSNPIIPPPQPPSIPSMRSNYYPGNGGGGFFPSLPFSNNQQPLDQSLNVPNHFGGAASNLGLLQGFSTNTAAIPSFGNVNPMLMNAAQNDWNFINNVNPTTGVSDTALWGTATPSGGDGNTIGSASGGFNLNPNPWPDLPGYGPPQ